MTVVPLLSVVVGLLLVFRNGSAYERYSEGRKGQMTSPSDRIELVQLNSSLDSDFTTLLTASRNISRLIWIQVALPPPSGDGKARPREKMTREILKAQKIKFLRLTVAFVIATVHHLRGESGTEHEDYKVDNFFVCRVVESVAH